MRYILGMMVLFMTIEGFAQAQDWAHYNSSLMIEVTRPNGVFTCSGVAVSDSLVVTAAHCLDGQVTKVRVFTGERYDPMSPSLEVSSFKIHPHYNPKFSQYQSDIAKIHLTNALPQSINIFPLYKNQTMNGKFFRFGFGARKNKNIRTVITPELKRVNLQDSILELNDKFSYSGDSGGPIFMNLGDQTYLVAIHSTFSFGPNGRYSYNPLISSFSSWIHDEH